MHVFIHFSGFTDREDEGRWEWLKVTNGYLNWYSTLLTFLEDIIVGTRDIKKIKILFFKSP